MPQLPLIQAASWTCRPSSTSATRHVGDGFHHPVKKPAGGKLTEAQQTCKLEYDQTI
ncbi:hypothetical protein [Streptomyces sp. SD31]|uniref:hypothetical protein n=1 Tax=Streptomyces sp. SD31 TaxID=3452208 RepID=UPI003F8BB6F3